MIPPIIIGPVASYVDNRPAPIATTPSRIVWRTLLNAHRGISGQRIQNYSHDADDERAPKSRGKIIHVKVRLHQVTNKVKDQRVHNQREKAEGNYRKQDFNWPENAVYNSQQQCGDDEIHRLAVVDSAHQVHGHQHREGVDDPALNELF